MEIRKKVRLKTHRRLALATGAFLTTILGVTVLGMSVFAPSTNMVDASGIAFWSKSVKDLNPPTLIGSHTAQAALADSETDNQQIKDGLDSLATSLDQVVGDGSDGGTVSNGTENGTERDENIERAADAGLATINVWKILWDLVWPKLQAFSGLIWTAVSTSG